MDEVCIGMPHRGRLNVLANIAGKSYGQIFKEFEGSVDPKSVQGSGDVKYHLGHRGHLHQRGAASRPRSISPRTPPTSRPSTRCSRASSGPSRTGSTWPARRFTVLPVLMHGDAAFAGQGVVAETLNLSQLRGYRTGGTIHLVVNNQVGFTTSPSSSRSSFYSTDVARMIQAPIFHVNGDDPEACVRVAELAFDFRQEFNKDVVIDLVCYRRRGHNEGDDPSMTQPLMYNLIEAKRSVRKLYTEALIGRGDITVEEAEAALQATTRPSSSGRSPRPRPRPRPRRAGARRRDHRQGRPGAAGRAGRDLSEPPREAHRGPGRGAAPDRRRVRQPARGLHRPPARSSSCWTGAGR